MRSVRWVFNILGEKQTKLRKYTKNFVKKRSLYFEINWLKHLLWNHFDIYIVLKDYVMKLLYVGNIDIIEDNDITINVMLIILSNFFAGIWSYLPIFFQLCAGRTNMYLLDCLSSSEGILEI